jgi:hypothetical protein
VALDVPPEALQKEFLTRRANHHHNGIIARIPKPAPATVAGFLVSLKSNGRVMRLHKNT